VIVSLFPVLFSFVQAGNIFINANGHILLGDFGVAAQLIEGGEAATGKRTFAGTPCWMAPEVRCFVFFLLLFALWCDLRNR
jgi:hypothetical protein